MRYGRSLEYNERGRHSRLIWCSDIPSNCYRMRGSVDKSVHLKLKQMDFYNVQPSPWRENLRICSNLEDTRWSNTELDEARQEAAVKASQSIISSDQLHFPSS